MSLLARFRVLTKILAVVMLLSALAVGHYLARGECDEDA